MTRIIELTGEEFEKFINEGEFYLRADRTLHIFPNTTNSNRKEIIYNEQGLYGYKPIKVTIELEYDETISFSEEDD